MNPPAPKSKSRKRLKYVVMLRRQRVEATEEARPYIGLENIEPLTGRLLAKPTATEEVSTLDINEVESTSNAFERSDVLFGKLRPYLAKVWVAEFPGRCTTELLVMQPTEIEPRFLRYVCLSRDFLDAVDASTFGSKMPRANWDFIGNMPVPVPLMEHQRAIADYLERETARLDALIAAKKELIDLLSEKRQALITHAVTRGLDLSVPLRYSGLPWLGQIPEHWGLKRGKWLFKERDERSTTGEEELLSLRMERGLIPHNDVSDKLTRSEELIGYKKVEKGEIVLNRMRASSGLVAVSPQNGLVSPDYAVFECAPAVDEYYFMYLFKTELLQAVFRSESTGLGTGESGFLRLYSESFLALWFPFPSFEEQQVISRYVTNETRKLDGLREATEHTLSLLKERRVSLITAAVMGKISVG